MLTNLSSTTLAIPPATNWEIESKFFVDGSLPFREGKYQTDVETGDILFMPLYKCSLLGFEMPKSPIFKN